jgi:LVIVD repeat
MRLLVVLFSLISLSSCWSKIEPVAKTNNPRVWGNKPIYGSFPQAKQITYSNTALPVMIPGNIYVKGDLIYQVETGRGIHVIDNSVPAQAYRVGFLTVNGSSQISIKGDFLYTNSYDDLVVIDISNSNNVHEVKRLAGAFPEGRYQYFYNQPIEAGYYECPGNDSVVIGWRKDSVTAYCFKN